MNDNYIVKMILCVYSIYDSASLEVIFSLRLSFWHTFSLIMTIDFILLKQNGLQAA